MLSRQSSLLLKPLIRQHQGRTNAPGSALVSFIQDRAMTVLSEKSKENFKKQNYSERMNRTGRPISPHITIYAFPIAAIASITTRITGCILSGACAGIGLVEILGGSGATLSLMQEIGTLSVVAPLTKFGASFCFFYHYLGGVRHHLWDSNPDRLLTNEDVEKSSYALLGTSFVISAGLIFL